MSKPHWIAIAGLHGYLPASCEVFDSAAAAVEYLVDLHELGQRRERLLRREHYIELDLRRDGNEYAEISECDCSDESIHSDS